MKTASLECIECALRARPEVLEAYLFGSQASGRVHGESDVDVAVYLDLDQVIDAPFGLAAEYATLLMAALGRNDVDVVILNGAPPLLYGRVLGAGRRVFARDLRATTTREGYALSRYFDWLPQQRKIDAAQSARIVRGDFGQ
jgi:hypothetical protein